MTRFTLLRNSTIGTHSPRLTISRGDTNVRRTYDDSVSYINCHAKQNGVARIKARRPRNVELPAPPRVTPSPAPSNVPGFYPNGDPGMQMLVYAFGFAFFVIFACVAFMVFA